MIKAKSLAIAVLSMMALTVCLAAPVLAAYYIDITAVESGGINYDMLSINASLPVDYLVDHHYIRSDGRDVRVKDHAGASIPFMLTEDRVLFAGDILASKSNAFKLTTGNTLVDNFDIVTGYGGYVTIADNANLELGNNFNVAWQGYVNTSASSTLIAKNYSVSVISNGAGAVAATLWKPTQITQTTQTGEYTLYNGGATRAGQRLNNFSQTYITSVSFYLKKGAGSPTGMAYIRVRNVTGDSILATLGTLDVSTLNSSYAWYDFTGLAYNPVAQDIRILVEYNGGSVANYITVGAAGDLVSGMLSYYDGTWHDESLNDATYKITYLTSDGKSVNATASTGEIGISLEADTSNLELYINGELKDSEALSGDSAPDISTNWVISMPYFDYYSHTTNGSLRLHYDPDSIISGTTLPNEQSPGTYDGVITYGSAPVTVSTSDLRSETAYYPTDTGTGGEDLLDIDTMPTDTDINTERLSHNPLNPAVIETATVLHLTPRLVWILGSLLLIFIAMTVTFIKTDQQFFPTIVVGFVSTGAFYALGALPWWSLLIMGIGLFANIVQEKNPQW